MQYVLVVCMSACVPGKCQLSYSLLTLRSPTLTPFSRVCPFIVQTQWIVPLFKPSVVKVTKGGGGNNIAGSNGGGSNNSKESKKKNKKTKGCTQLKRSRAMIQQHPKTTISDPSSPHAHYTYTFLCDKARLLPRYSRYVEQRRIVRGEATACALRTFNSYLMVNLLTWAMANVVNHRTRKKLHWKLSTPKWGWGTIRSEGKERGKDVMISKTFDLFVEDIMETDANGDGGGGEGGGDGD